jgi:tetratricopeptide (TPR) repeat protein
VYTETGRYDQALAAFTKAAELRGSPPAARLARTYARMGRTEDARQTLRNPSAEVYAALGDRDRAFALLFQAVEQRDDWHLYVKRDPAFDSLTTDARWPELLARMNLSAD